MYFDLTEEDLKGLTHCLECGCTEISACPEGCGWATPDRCTACIRVPTRKELMKVESGERIYLAETGAPLLTARVERVTKTQLVCYGGVRVLRGTGRMIGRAAHLVRLIDREEDLFS